ncbi:tubulin polymerization-promoting protein family member 3-like [Watersipora subatra]|uniref:tubulin polymerization-promoting protein family member 3-like n=1 Tax=Watersipora subatra TaxID=2589382 RepID=UPI00355C7D15
MGDYLKTQFITFCNFGAGVKGNKSTLTDKNLTKMFKDCKLYGKFLTTTDTDIAFSKVKEKGKKEITFTEFEKLLEDIAPKYAKSNRLSLDAGSKALIDAISEGGPSLAGTTGVSKTGAVDRMTDHTQYTGSHRERFDETGRGKGLQGRQASDASDASDGYVGNYRGSGTYDKVHNK